MATQVQSAPRRTAPTGLIVHRPHPELSRTEILPKLLGKTARASSPHSSEGKRNGIENRIAELLPLVRQTALSIRRRLPAQVEFDDLIASGNLGLLDAARKFDPRRHVQFQYYARHRIRGAILDSLRNLDGASRDLRGKAKKAERVHRDLEARLGRAPGDTEMARAMGVTLERWYRTLREFQSIGVDWRGPVGSDGSGQAPEAALIADPRENPFDLCYRAEQRELIARALARLPERQRRIVVLYHYQNMSMKQIGTMLGIDESRVSQLHSTTLLRLKSLVKEMLRRPQPRATPLPEKSRIPLSGRGNCLSLPAPIAAPCPVPSPELFLPSCEGL